MNDRKKVEKKELMFDVLEQRFQENMHRHKDISWESVLEKLKENDAALKALKKMEETGGEPDVVAAEGEEGILFMDCVKESPEQRRNLCYDEEARKKRKKNPPEGSAWKMAEEMGIRLLSEELYRTLQEAEQVDLKTSSWIKTPEGIRNLGGALFGDRRYDAVFIYHNGADSYYGSRGFRGYLII